MSKIFNMVQMSLHSVRFSMEENKLDAEDAYQLSKMIMIMHRAFQIRSSQKLQESADRLMLSFKEAMSHYDPNAGVPLIMTDEFISHLRQMATSFDKLLDQRIITETEIGEVCIYVGELLDRNESNVTEHD